MDLAKYIGLFLLKNRFCYIHGLGNLEVKKKPATYDGKALQSSPYEVVITPAGSIDDTLANFIATNEQISISKAANALRDFSTQSRADLQAGKEVVIPHLGKFVEEHGKISFITDTNFQYTPPGIPTIKTTLQQQQGQQAPAKQEPVATNNPLPAPDFSKYAPKPQKTASGGSSLNWTRIILAGVIALVIIGAVIFMFMMRGSNNQAVNIPVPVNKDAMQQAPPSADTTGRKVDSSLTHQGVTPPAVTATMPPPDSIQAYKMIVGVYTDKAKAEKRVNQFTKQLGKKAELVSKDSTNFYVVMSVKCKPVDTTHVEDSLKRFYYPSGKVSIYQ